MIHCQSSSNYGGKVGELLYGRLQGSVSLALGTGTLFFFFHPIILFSNLFFWLPIILWIISHYSPWLGCARSIEGLPRPEGETRLMLTLPYTTESTRVRKSWRTKTIEQRRLIDDRVRLTAVGVAGFGRRWCHHHTQWSLHEARLLDCGKGKVLQLHMWVSIPWSLERRKPSSAQELVIVRSWRLKMARLANCVPYRRDRMAQIIRHVM